MRFNNVHEGSTWLELIEPLSGLEAIGVVYRCVIHDPEYGAGPMLITLEALEAHYRPEPRDD